ncbi:MAG: VOC family protein [Beijerinckiaceae bacterium]
MGALKPDHCVIHVSDWNRSNRSYADVLGAEIVPRQNGFCSTDSSRCASIVSTVTVNHAYLLNYTRQVSEGALLEKYGRVTVIPKKLKQAIADRKAALCKFALVAAHQRHPEG